MWTIITILIAFTIFAIGLNANQAGLIPNYYREMTNPGWFSLSKWILC